MMYPKWMYILVCYFDLWGLPTEFQTSEYYKRIVRYTSILHFLLGFIVTILLVKYLQRPIDDPLGTLNDVIKHGGSLAVYWLTLIELNAKHRMQKEFWQTFKQIDSLFSSHQHLSMRTYVLKFCICLIAFLFVCVLYLQEIISKTGTEFVYFWFTHFILIMTYLNRVFYHLFCMELIKNELRNIKNETKELVRANQSGPFAVAMGRCLVIEEFQLKRFKWLRDYFQSIHGMCDHLSEMIGWSTVVTIIFSFQLIATDGIWIYWKLYNKQHVQQLR